MSSCFNVTLVKLRIFDDNVTVRVYYQRSLLVKCSAATIGEENVCSPFFFYNFLVNVSLRFQACLVRVNGTEIRSSTFKHVSTGC